MLKSKCKLSVTVGENTIFYHAANYVKALQTVKADDEKKLYPLDIVKNNVETSVETWEKIGREKRVSDKYKLAEKQLVNLSGMTDLASAYMYHVIPKMVYQSLNTIYAQSGHDMVRRIIVDLISTRKNQLENTVDFNQYLENDSINPVMQETVLHNTKRVKNGDKWYNMEVGPYETLEWTEYGREVLALDKTETSTTADDLLQDCYLLYCKLYNAGLINKTSDVWAYRYAFYKTVNNRIYSERKSVPVSNIGSDASESEKLLVSIADTVNVSDMVADKTDVNAIIEAIVSQTSKHVDKELMYNVLYGAMSGYTQQAIADRNSVNIRKVQRYYVIAKKILSEVRQRNGF